jgi:oligoribonuclease NrnB/cAMP/cGMP phosphodiesterase (DHH superfamily)
VGNKENEYPVPDPKKTMINVTYEFSDTHKKNLSKKKSWMRSLRNSWRSYKTWLTRKYKIQSRNIKIPQIKN